ncbi:MAG: tetratricopeptide repeat protein, partial [Longimicrobiales bacterium]
AQDFYEGALVLDPGFALARASLSQVHGKMYWLRFDPQPARAELQRAEAEEALRTDPTLPQARVAMGLAHYWGRHDYTKAVNEFNVALVGLPNDSWLWTMVGLVHRRLGNWVEALDAFEKAVQLSPGDVVGLQALAETFHFLRRYPEAARTYDRALVLAPDHHGMAVDRARRTYLLWGGEVDTLRAVLERLPDEAFINRGTRMGQIVRLLHWERQAEDLQQVLSEMPPDAVIEEQDFFLPVSLFSGWAHKWRGEADSAAEAFELARALLDSALIELRDDRRIHFARGLALAGLGLREEALEEAKWLERSPQYHDDKYGGTVSMYQRAQILAQVDEAVAALDEIERLLAGPSVFVSVHTLRLDPLWDPLRKYPRFDELLTRYSNPPDM